MKGFVYILISLKDNKQYIGSSINPTKRLHQHNQGNVISTRNRRPFELKYIIEFENIAIATNMERKFKRSHDALKREVSKRGIIQT